MLITESQLGTGFGRSGMSLLENMSYLTEEESQYHAAMVPVIENTEIGANIVALEDIMKFAESNGIDDLGYALGCVCEASNIGANTVAFSVQETSVIADQDVASLVSDIMNEGAPIVAVPLSSYDPAYTLAEASIDYMLETGDSTFLEAYVNDDFEVFDEARSFDKDAALASYTNKYNRQYAIAHGRGGKVTGAQIASAKAWLADQNEKYGPDPIKGFRKRSYEVKGEVEQHNNDFYGAEKTRQRGIKDVLAHAQWFNQGKDQDTGEDAPAPTNAEVEKVTGTSPADAAAAKTASGGSGASAGGGAAPAPAAPDPQKTESFLEKIKKNAIYKPRDWIAAKIASLNAMMRRYMANFHQADPAKRSIFMKIKNMIAKAIEWLTRHLNNAMSKHLGAKDSKGNAMAVRKEFDASKLYGAKK